MTFAHRSLLLSLLLLPLAACGEDEAPAGAAPLAVEFRSSPVLLFTERDTIRLSAEIAEEPSQHSMGLMERTSLPDSAGMLFLFPQQRPADAGFWMFRTRIPLDIAFMDSTGTIVAVRTMEPCASPEPQWCQTYAPGVPYRSALEVNGGFLARVGAKVGDRVMSPEAPSLLADSAAAP